MGYNISGLGRKKNKEREMGTCDIKMIKTISRKTMKKMEWYLLDVPSHGRSMTGWLACKHKLCLSLPYQHVRDCF